MNKEKIISELQLIVRDIIFDEEIVLLNETTAQDIVGWDSVAHVLIISVIETEFNIQFNLKEVQELEKVGDTVDLIYSKLSLK
jgi:acyl carrier protein|tara:strand:- start:2909 stop:3157 length:249 start_codon:yes stop_codon:yes gene_type:complete